MCLESNGKILATARRRDDGWWESATWPQGPTGLWASAAEARAAFLAARAARRPSGVAARDVVGVQRMLMGWYASDTARASVRDRAGRLDAEHIRLAVLRIPLRFIVASSAGAVFITNGRRAGR